MEKILHCGLWQWAGGLPAPQGVPRHAAPRRVAFFWEATHPKVGGGTVLSFGLYDSMAGQLWFSM